MNEDGRVVVDSVDPVDRERFLGVSDDGTYLRGAAAASVRALIAECRAGEDRRSHILPLDAAHYVRVTRLDGAAGCLFAVSVERFREADSLARAARKFRLTPREMDVLALILEGASAIETALALSIAETTVHGYYKRLLNKTRSRNRAAMVANVLEWRGSTEGDVSLSLPVQRQ